MQEQRFTDVDRELHELRQKHSRELNAQRQRAIDRELAEVDHQLTRLNRKYSRLKEVLQYEVLNRLTKGTSRNIFYHLYLFMLLL
jgi:DNA-binding TFAR19-related protein (PDSD5 family)